MQQQRIPTWTGFTLAAVLAGGLSAGFACGGDDTKPSVTAYCANICARSEKGACKGDTGDCDSECAANFADTPSRCATQQDELLRCASRADFVCDSNDESDAPACDAKVTAFTKCVGTGGGSVDGGTVVHADAGGSHDAGVVADAGRTDSGTVTTPDAGVTVSAESKRLCASQCQAVIATGCANDGTQAACLADCIDTVASFGDACPSDVKAVLMCLSTATYTCDTSGQADTTTCNTQLASLQTCAGGGTTASCTVSSTDTPCQSCAATNCCAEREACGADCQALDTCYSACTDNACYDACDASATAAAYTAEDNLYTCLTTYCASSC